MSTLHCRSDGSINHDFYRHRAGQERSAYVRLALSTRSPLPALTPERRRRVKLFVAAFALATAAFWSTMLTSPPTTVAGGPAFSIDSLQRNAPLDLPVTTADAI